MNKQNELYHHGVKGQKWGVRRYQNKDGSFTPLGQKRNADKILKVITKSNSRNDYDKKIMQIPEVKSKYSTLMKKHYDKLKTSYKQVNAVHDKYKSLSEDEKRKYIERSATKACDRNGITDKNEIKKVIEEFKHRDYRFEDVRNGNDTPFSLYLKDNNLEKEYNNKRYAAEKSKKEYVSSCKKAVDELISDYGKQEFKSKNLDKKQTVSTAVGKQFVEHMSDDLFRNDNISVYFGEIKE